MKLVHGIEEMLIQFDGLFFLSIFFCLFATWRLNYEHLEIFCVV